MDGQSFLPFLKDEAIKSNDRYRFFHGGRWPLNPENTNNQKGTKHWVGTIQSSNPDSSIYRNCAVRNERYRFVNNKELYDVINDPGQTRDIEAEYPEVVLQMRKAYDEWWNEVRPYMVNENAPLANEKPYWTAYNKQLEF